MKIVYTSNTGYTKQYAELLAEKTGYELFEINNALEKLPKNEEIIFLGWLMAGKIKDYKKASKYFSVKIIAAVGLATGGERDKEVRQANSIPSDTTLFTLQGGYAPEKLKGIYKFMMKLVTKVLAKQLREKAVRNEEEEFLLSLLENGGNGVSEEKLAPLLEFLS